MRIRNLRVIAALLWFALLAPPVLSAPTQAAPSTAAAVSEQNEDRDGKNLGQDLYRTERGKFHREKRAQDGNLGKPQLNYGTAWEPIEISQQLLPKFRELMAQHWGKVPGEETVAAWPLTAEEVKSWRVDLYDELLRETNVTADSVVLIIVGSNQTSGPHMEMIFLRALTTARYIAAALTANPEAQVEQALRRLDNKLAGKAARKSDEYARILKEELKVNGRPVNSHLRLSPGGTSDNQACGAVGGVGCHPYGRSLDYAVPYAGDIERDVATTKQAKYLIDYLASQIQKHINGNQAYLNKLFNWLQEAVDFLRDKVRKQPRENEQKITAEREDVLIWSWRRVYQLLREMERRELGDRVRTILSDLEWYWSDGAPTNPVALPPDVEKGMAENARRQARGLMAPGCSTTAAGCERGKAPESGLEKSLAAAAGGRNGGIDLRSLELRYLSDKPDDGQKQVKYAFAGAPAKDFAGQHLEGGLSAAQQASDAFFVWLSMRPESFWVNLSPDEPDRIVDAKIGRTDVGRIMLQGDLRMKKTVGELIHPDTKLGKEYWKHLKGKCFSFRNWIVPGKASVYATGDELYIVDAPLTVKSEADYLTNHGADDAKGCRQESQATENRNEALYRKLILPRLERAVNKAPEYAQLRRIYLSRIAAEWYRARDKQRPTAYSSLIDSGDVSRWPHSGTWKPRDTFDDYVDSYRQGEFKVKHRTRKGNYIYTNTYIYGGVDWSKLNLHRMSRQSFEQRAPRLAANVEQAVSGQASADGDQVLVGGSTPDRDSARPAGTGGLPVWGYLATTGVLLLGTVLVLRRRFSSSSVAQTSLW